MKIIQDAEYTNFDNAVIISGEILSRHFSSIKDKKISPAVKNNKKNHDAYRSITIAKIDKASYLYFFRLNSVFCYSCLYMIL